MSHKQYDVSTLEQFVGQELGVSDWLTVDQERINEFADCTGDHQWIHVDIERAKRESPLGSTIVHGYLTLSLFSRKVRLSQKRNWWPGRSRTWPTTSIRASLSSARRCL